MTATTPSDRLKQYGEQLDLLACVLRKHNLLDSRDAQIGCLLWYGEPVVLLKPDIARHIFGSQGWKMEPTQDEWGMSHWSFWRVQDGIRWEVRNATAHQRRTGGAVTWLKQWLHQTHKDGSVTLWVLTPMPEQETLSPFELPSEQKTTSSQTRREKSHECKRDIQITMGANRTGEAALCAAAGWALL